MSNETLYNEYIKEVFPRELFVEIFSKYYGEDKKEFICDSIENIKVAFIPKKVSSYKIKQAYYECRGNVSDEQYEKEAGSLIFELDELVNGNIPSRVIIDTLIKNQDIIEKLGFDLHQIIKRSKVLKMLSIVPTEETNRFKDFIANEVKNTKVTAENIEFNSFINYYNKCASENKLFNFTSNRENDLFSVMPSESWKLTEQDFSSNKFFIIGELKKEDKEFIFDLFESKSNIDNLDKNMSQYVVKNINRIFGTTHKNIKEILSDPRLMMFFSCIEEVKIHTKQFIYDQNINTQQFIAPELTADEYNELSSYFSNSACAAVFYNHINGVESVIGIPILEKFPLSYSIHEVNHALGLNVNGDTGFARFGIEDERTKEGSIRFNEIVNEFLTKRAIENYNSKLSDPSKSVEIAECGYDIGIKLMEKFLLKFEDKLKDCQLAETTSQMANVILENYIGIENYYKIRDFAADISENNGGWFNVPIKSKFPIKRAMGINDLCNIADWLEEYEKNPEIIDLVPKEDLGKVIKFIEMHKFFDKLVEKYDTLESSKDREKY